VGPAISAPLLDFGKLDATVEKPDYRARELLFAYKQTVLYAFREVGTAIDAYAAQQNRLRHLAECYRGVAIALEAWMCVTYNNQQLPMKVVCGPVLRSERYVLDGVIDVQCASSYFRKLP
jgi:hypothetical protein